MPPQPHPPVAEGAWLRPRPARQSPDCRRGRVHRHASRRPARVRLKAAAFPAQHIRSALSQSAAGGAAHRRLRRIPAGRRDRMRRGLPSPGSVGIPPVAGSAASRLPPSASPAVTAFASCRRPSSPLRATLALGREGCRICIWRSVIAPYEDHWGQTPRKACFMAVSWGLSPRFRNNLGNGCQGNSPHN